MDEAVPPAETQVEETSHGEDKTGVESGASVLENTEAEAQASPREDITEEADAEGHTAQADEPESPAPPPPALAATADAPEPATPPVDLPAAGAAKDTAEVEASQEDPDPPATVDPPPVPSKVEPEEESASLSPVAKQHATAADGEADTVPALPTAVAAAPPRGGTAEIEAIETEEEVPCSAGAQVHSHLRTGSVDGAAEPPVVSLGEMLAPQDELARQRAGTLAVHRDAQEEEEKLMAAMQHMVSRLEAGRTACNGMGKLLRDLAATEGAYAKACFKMSQTAVLPSGGDGSNTLFAACEAMACLPRAAAVAHRAAEERLLAAAGEAMACANTAYIESNSLTAGVREKQKHLRSARDGLRDALHTLERVAQRQAELQQAAAGSERGKGAPARTGLPPFAALGASARADDVWLAESALAEAHQNLYRAQESANAMFATAIQRVEEHQKQRQETLTVALRSCVGVYQQLANGLAENVAGVAGVLEAAQSEFDSGGDALPAAACEAQQAFQRMHAMQQGALASRTAALFNSPHIVRRARLSLVEGGKAPTEHTFVLTRSGYLHWYLANDELAPSNGVNLARCSIDNVESASFVLTETGMMSVLSGPRRLTLSSASTEDVMQWVFCLREAIQGPSAPMAPTAYIQ